VAVTEQELLQAIRERLTYDRERGRFFRKAGFPGVVAGAPLASKATGGGLQTTFLGKRYQVSWLVWLVETGSWPTEQLRHRNGDPADCRIENLALASELSAERHTLRCAKHGELTISKHRKKIKGLTCPYCAVEAGKAAAAKANAARPRLLRKTPEERAETRRKYQQEHRELYRESQRRFCERLKTQDPERWKARLKEGNERAKAWRKTDKGRIRRRIERQVRRVRMRLAANASGVSVQDWLAICERFTDASGQVCCAYCKQPCSPTMDHVVPIARGGAHEPSNIVPACGPCNSSKCDQLLSEWPRAMALLSEAEMSDLVK
jgi:5-methylcytosine-specific restriction endonuclease McrA